ncbi:transposase, partial [Neptunomonas japonica]|uniref:transposase n=1 Tax=Neptunomonas japonica TaxID=417574 RepID=UPI00146F01E7
MDHHNNMPVAGTDYPTTLSQFLDWFHSEEACRAYLEKLKWPDGIICPKCNAVSNVIFSSRKRWVCRSCKHQTTVTAGTIFDKTRTELRIWFVAIWYITN